MRLRPCLIAACGMMLLSSGSSTADEPKAAQPKETFWVIPHTHWEGAVFKTREEYLDMGLANILKAMRLLREQPGFRFTLDQVAYVRPFLERFPGEEADFRRFLAEGRLQLAGALDVMPDDNMPGGETFVRQMIYGKGYYREKLGVDVTSGWQLDTFGHHAQMPQLMALGGIQVVLVLPRRAPAGLPLGVHLGRDRRHEDRCLLAAARLRARLSHAQGPGGIPTRR